jgi:hypothetical protein
MTRNGAGSALAPSAVKKAAARQTELKSTMSPRTHKYISAPLFALLLTGAAAVPAAAQWTVTGVGVAEYDTNETWLLLAGVSASPWGGPGIAPVFGVQAYRLSYLAATGRTYVTSIRPSAGLRYNFGTGSAQARIGYAFTSRDAPPPVTGTVVDRRDGVVLSGQVDYWGAGGPFGAQWLGSYNFGSSTLWTRGRLSTRIATTTAGQVRLGGEVAFLNDSDADFTMWQPGVVLEWHTGGTILAAGVGRKFSDPGDDATYVKAEVVVPLFRGR